MPLFFLLSGFTSNFVGEPWPFIRKKVLTLVLPYVITLFIFYLYWLFFYKWYSGDGNSPTTIASILAWGGIYGSGMALPESPSILPIGPLWFILALFSANLIGFYIMMVARRSIIAGASLVCITVVIGLAVGPRLYLPFSIDIAFVAQLFIFAGIALRRFEVLSAPRSWLLILASVCALVISRYNGAMDMNGRNYNDFFISSVGAMGGSILVLYAAISLERIPRLERILSYLGRASLVILCFHTADTSFFHFPQLVPSIYQWLDAHPLWLSVWRLSYSMLVFEAFRRIPFMRYAYSLPRAARVS
ncbi:hypothetical protein BLL37_29520 [Pseudomonas azotoformans]|uniref:Acyltransferase 3 domain-containing protein n=2 Tax=Pseudomonas azotoformans TaxID=47878 RepID=A0A1V2J5V2_PSEAZ|nr:hypothetical protein BFL39_23585 [Pseudomonas azotoformans]ONH40136.1 hypothetical protein BLL37_29520 [Pseudomonas azotoformans]